MLAEELIQLTIYHSIREKLVTDGWLPDILNYDVENPDIATAQLAIKAYTDAMKAINLEKGFCIEVFPFSSSEAKGFKKVPRIVIDILQFLPGFIGNDTQMTYERQGEYFVRVQSESLLSDLDFNVYIVGNTAKQIRVMNDIISKVLPKRGYIKRHNSDFLTSGNLFIKLNDAQKSENLPEGIMERVFRYELPEVQDLPDTILAGLILPIKEFNLEVKTDSPLN
jgi:hypothetical protein